MLYWFNSYDGFAEWVGFTYWWSFIEKGLRLQPEQQACFAKDHQASKLMNYLINDRGVCRTALATPGLLIIMLVC